MKIGKVADLVVDLFPLAVIAAIGYIAYNAYQSGCFLGIGGACAGAGGGAGADTVNGGAGGGAGGGADTGAAAASPPSVADPCWAAYNPVTSPANYLLCKLGVIKPPAAPSGGGGGAPAPTATAPPAALEVLKPSVDTRLSASATITAINEMGLRNTATGGWLSTSQVQAIVAPIQKAKLDLAADKAHRSECAAGITAKAKAEYAAGIRPTPYWTDQDYINYAGCK